MRAGCFARSLVGLGRFVPPWEKEGRSADDYFGGLMNSSNPFQKAKRDRVRYDEETEIVEAEEAMDSVADQRYEERFQQEQDKLAQKAEEKVHFLPYGSQPQHYSSLTQLPTWGTYQDGIKDCAYSDSTKQAMMSDADTQIPYRFEDWKAVPSWIKGNKQQWPLHGSAGLVLDIDGVVYRSKQMLPGSADAIAQLKELKIPTCFMTNGGGVTEEKKAEELSRIIGTEIKPEQVLMAHTPMQLLAKKYEDENVLIVGPRGCLEAARRYGFKKAIYMEDFQAEHPELVPFKRWPTGEGIEVQEPNTVPYQQISAVFAFTDSFDVLNDIQVICDVLVSPFGQIGSSVSGQQTVPLYVSADDLLWATNAKLPRLGMGAFREMTASVYESVTGNNLQVVQYGKPRAIAYKFAEQRLRELSGGLGWDPYALRTICMVGDNLETDIIGANAAGGPWLSVHVMTGIGSAPSAARHLSEGDDEAVWLAEHVPKTPHYVAPSLDHFVRELLAFGEDAVTLNKTQKYGPPNPADLSTYNFDVYGGM